MRKILKLSSPIFFTTFLALLLSFVCVGYSVVLDEPKDKTQNPTAKPEYVQGEVLVKFRDGVDPSTVLGSLNMQSPNIDRIHSIKPVAAKFKKDYKLDKEPGNNGWYSFLGKNYKEISDIPDDKAFEQAYTTMPEVEKGLYRTYKVKLPEGMGVEEAVAKLKDDPNVEFAQGNGKMIPYMTPNDPYYSTSGAWGQSFDDLYGLKKLQCAQAWDLSQGEGVVVAVIDTGIDYNHPDLSVNIWTNADEIPGNGIDDDGNGYIDDVRGYDMSDNDSDPSDYYGHGTHCAGTIAAVGNNNIGVIGVAPRAKVMPVKIFPNATSDVCIQGIKYAADNGAKVLSNSWGPSGRQPSNPALEQAIDYAYSKGCIIVFAAGNAGDEVQYYSPANYSKVITVAATDNNDQQAPFSNYGANIDVAAPGADVLSLRASGTDMYSDGNHFVPAGNTNAQYYRSDGTSMACPHAAGTSALIIKLHPDWTAEQIRNVLKSSSDPIITTTYVGQGRLNAFKAASISTIMPDAKLGELGTADIFDIIGTAGGANFSRYELYAGGGFLPQSWTLLAMSSSPVINGVLCAAFDKRVYASDGFTIKLEVYDTAGRKIEKRLISGRIDQSPITFPLHNDILKRGKVIEIRGSIWADATNIKLEQAKGLSGTPVWTNSGITLTGQREGIIARWDTSVLPHNDFYSLRITLDLPCGTRTDTVDWVYLDDKMREGWPVHISNHGTNWADNEQQMVVADIDLDGCKEVITCEIDSSGEPPDNWNYFLCVYGHDGTLRWKRALPSVGEYPIKIMSQKIPAVGNIDNDPQLEIVITGGTDYRNKSALYAFKSNGDLAAGNWPISALSEFDASNLSTNLIADINGDGKNEIVSMSTIGCNGVLITDGLGNKISSFALPNILHGNLLMPGKGVVGQFDSDGQLEIAVQYDASKLAIFKLDGTILPGWPVDTGGRSVQGALSAGNIDGSGDGLDELMVSVRNTDGSSSLFIYDRSGNLLPGWPVIFSWSPPCSLADFDNDGDLEICLNIGEQLCVYHHTGIVAAGWPQFFTKYYTCSYESPVIADVNGDGAPDIIVSAGGRMMPEYPEALQRKLLGRIVAFGFDGTPIKLNGDPSMDDIYHEGTGFYNGPPPTICDMDNNGKLDIVVSSPYTLGVGRNNRYEKKRCSITAWELEVPYNPLKSPWPMWQCDIGHTGRYVNAKANRSPALAAIGNKTIKVGDLLTFIISATDPENNPLTYSASNLPAGASFNSGTLTFSWTPASNQAGTYNVTFTVSDGSSTDSETITITVNNVNAPPSVGEMTPSAGSSRAGQKWIFSTSFIDNDGYSDIDSVYLHMYLPSGGIAAYFVYSQKVNKIYLGDRYQNYVGGSGPGSADTIENSDIAIDCSQTTITVSGGTLTVNWAVIFKSPLAGNTYNFYLSAMDSNGASSAYLNKGSRTVTSSNNPPVFNLIGSKSVNEGQPLQFTVSATDTDDDALTYSISGLPAGAAFDTATRTFSWTPAYIQAGPYNVTFIVSDGTVSVSEAITITVNDANAPLYLIL